MPRIAPLALTGILVLVPAAGRLQPSLELPPQALSGGMLSVADKAVAAYSLPIPSLGAKQAELFALGHKMFINRWAFFWFENAEFGRGPTSNAQACTTCHARNFMEAILCHGGESKVSREACRKLPKTDREALVAFLPSL